MAVGDTSGERVATVTAVGEAAALTGAHPDIEEVTIIIITMAVAHPGTPAPTGTMRRTITTRTSPGIRPATMTMESGAVPSNEPMKTMAGTCTVEAGAAWMTGSDRDTRYVRLEGGGGSAPLVDFYNLFIIIKYD